MMSLAFEVSLISGKTVSLETHGDESVESLRRRAQRALGVGKGRLLTSTGRVLDGEAPLKSAGLHNLPLTFHIRRVDIQATVFAFAAILRDGSVVSWGDADRGGDSSAVRDQLKNVQQIQATYRAFAAILADGCVVTYTSVTRAGV